MTQHLTGKSHLTIHVLLGEVLVVCAVVIAHSPSAWRAVASVAAGTFATHAGIARRVRTLARTRKRVPIVCSST